MHDPWDVASTRRSDQYVSCMKISGVPLLPPVLSKECRKEMQYYRILALEVEKRISHLKDLGIDSSFNEVSEDSEKITNAKNNLEDCCPNTRETSLVANGHESLRSDVTVIDNSDNSPVLNSPKLVSDVIGDLFKDSLNNVVGASRDTPEEEEEPERDYNCLPNKLLTEPEMTETKDVVITNEHNENTYASISSTAVNEKRAPSPCKFQSNGPPSLTNSKSVDNIHAELSFLPKLTRQRSYTILKPSPALLAHLEVQSLNSGVEMSSISMSESCSNISWLGKKRRSWDLETAKVKWSSMATELNKDVKKSILQKRTHVARPNNRAQTSQPSVRARSTTQERSRRYSVPTTHLNSNSTYQKLAPQTISANTSSSTRNLIDVKPDNVNKISSPLYSKNISSECDSPDEEFTARLSMITSNDSHSQSPSPIKSSGSTSPKEDPSACIKGLYDKIRTQQMVRMASLLEKQKKEKTMLQQVFEEQNALFYKQLKTICPTSPKKVKEAWSEKTPAKDSSPVRLSQLINSGGKSQASSGVASTVLNDSQSYIQKTDDALKKSRNVLLGVKGSQNSKIKPKSPEYNSSPYAAAAVRPRPLTSSGIRKREEKSARTVTDSSSKYTPQSPRRHLNSNNSQSSRDVEPILTDRTNDTMADLNFTLPNDDKSDLCSDALYRDYNTTFILNDGRKDNSVKSMTVQCPSKSPTRYRSKRCGSVDSATDPSHTLREYSLHTSKNQVNTQSKSMRKLFSDNLSDPREIEAASRIVAHAKGYLVRRLLRTERVQATVQTIRDALICALQLHQDREGIRGADVNLHRRLIQQITAACYSLHETFIVNSPQDRCALISQDRDRQRALEEKQMSGSFSFPKSLVTPTRRIVPKRKTDRDVMSHSHSGVFVAGRACRLPHYSMTQSTHEMYSSEDKSHRPSSKKFVAASKELHSRRPWR